MNKCADAAYKESDKKLNELYKQIEARLKIARVCRHGGLQRCEIVHLRRGSGER